MGKKFIDKFNEMLRIEKAKSFCYGEQYAADLWCLALHDVLGLGKDRLVKVNERYFELAEYFKALRKEDRKEQWMFEAELERNLEQVLGDVYQPREERYKTLIRDCDSGAVLAVSSCDDLKGLM